MLKIQMEREFVDTEWMFRQVDASEESLIAAVKARDAVDMSCALSNEKVVRLCEDAIVRARKVYDENLIGFSSKKDALFQVITEYLGVLTSRPDGRTM